MNEPPDALIRARPWLALAIVALVATIWMGRYEIVGAERVAYRLDRWTGAVALCPGGQPCMTTERPRN